VLTYFDSLGYNQRVNIKEVRVEPVLSIALIINSVALIASVVLQSKGIGLGGLTGVDSGGVYSQRRGVEKVLFWVTVGLSVLFVILTLITVIITG
jgi:preprotein translocase subunit SecG